MTENHDNADEAAIGGTGSGSVATGKPGAASEGHPYLAKVGVIEPGALADLLIVDGDPTKNLDFLGEPDKNLQLIMKDGHIYKNQLQAS